MDPDLVLVFADLTIVAALLLGNDGEKGMAHYCKGSILFRLGKLREAVGLLNDAQAYLRSAGDPRQLANCLFDAANCLGQLGDYRSALGLLEEVLRCQDGEKDRTETQAFMLVLAQRSGGKVMTRSWTVSYCSCASAR